MARPTTRSVVREEIAALTPALAEAIAKILGAQPAVVTARIATAPSVQPKARTFKTAPVAAKVASKGKRERIEKAPEGGYADRVTVVSGDRGDQPRPYLRGLSGAQVEEVLAGNFNVYFFRESDDASVKPTQQIREELMAAGFRFTMDHKIARYYGPKAKLPAQYRSAIES